MDLWLSPNDDFVPQETLLVWLRTYLHPLKYPKNIFFGEGNLQSWEQLQCPINISKSPIFHMKTGTEMLFETQNSNKVITSNDKIIHIHKNTEKDIRGSISE